MSAKFSQAGKDGEIIVNQNVVLVDGNSAYLFVFISPNERAATLAPAFKKILASFEIVK